MDFSISEIRRGKSIIYLMAFQDFSPTDCLHHLSASEQERMFSFRHLRRRQEFVATRILRHETIGFQHIHYDTHGAPFIDNEGYISISHGAGIVGLGINQYFKIGLDLETPRENILALYPKFLSEKEEEQFDTTSVEELTKIWSAKEAMYKLAGRKKIHFKSELCIERNEEDQWKGEIINPDHRLSVDLDIFDFNDTVVSINSEAIVKKY